MQCRWSSRIEYAVASYVANVSDFGRFLDLHQRCIRYRQPVVPRMHHFARYVLRFRIDLFNQHTASCTHLNMLDSSCDSTIGKEQERRAAFEEP